MLEQIISVVRQAGEIVTGAKHIDSHTYEKTSAADLVTDYDIAVENFLKEKLGEGVIVLASDCEGKVNLVAMATEEAMAHGAHAGNLIKAIAGKVGGGGGGRPNMAQAGGKNPSGMKDAIAEVFTALDGMIQ